MTYLLQAINANQMLMVEFFIQKISYLPEKNQKLIYKSINLNLARVEQTDLSILRKLKAKAVQFSELAEATIDLKENRPIGYLLSIEIMLTKFTDYIKETLSKQDEMKNNLENYKSLKNHFSLFSKKESLDTTKITLVALKQT